MSHHDNVSLLTSLSRTILYVFNEISTTPRFSHVSVPINIPTREIFFGFHCRGGLISLLDCFHVHQVH